MGRRQAGNFWVIQGLKNIQCGLHLLLVFSVVSLLLLTNHLYTTFPASLDLQPGCSIPNYDPFDPITKDFVRTLSPVDCNPEPWLTRAEGGLVLLNAALLVGRRERLINCSYQAIERASDEDVVFSRPVAFSREARPEADFVRVECFTRTASGKERQYQAFHHVMREKPRLEQTLQTSLLERRTRHSRHAGPHQPQDNGWINVVMIGIDSVSRFSMIRLMPRLRHFLSDQLHAIELTNYNKVGDNTFPNILGLLTGRKVDENSEDMLSSLGVLDKSAMDKQGLRFLWNDFRDAGFRTLYCEDSTGVGTFNWGKGSGFQDPPTHYYFRPMELAKEKHSGLFTHGGACFAGFPNDVLLLNYTLDYCRLFKDKPHFALTFLVASTHGDINGGSLADGYHTQFLSTLQAEGLLDNTLLIYFSDHGVRGLRSATGFRKTPMGKFEEMRPFMFLAFPAWFREAYPHLLDRVQENAARLTTPFDIHSTVLGVLHLHMDDLYSGQRKNGQGISLFKKIPAGRTCVDAGIPVQYCVCLKDRPLSPESSLALEAGVALMAALNAAQRDVTDECHALTLENVTDFVQVEGGGRYLDIICAGWLPDKSLYRVTVRAQPSGAVFEATMSKCSGFTPFEMQGEVTRLNWYGDTSQCVRQDRVLKKICFCKKL